MRVETDKRRVHVTFDSISDLVETASTDARVANSAYYRNHFPEYGTWMGKGVTTFDDATRLAREGLPTDGIEAMALAEESVDEIYKEHDMPAFSSFYDVTGADVDVARFLSGEPENMINYTMIETPKVGRVVSLVVASIFSGTCPAAKINERGQAIMGLVTTLESLGLQTEIWADWTTGKGNTEGRITVPLKQAGESLDAGLVMYALTHASFSRGFIMPSTHLYPQEYHQDHMVGGGYGPINSNPNLHSYPEGSIYLPAPRGYGENYDTLIQNTLRQLGILED